MANMDFSKISKKAAIFFCFFFGLALVFWPILSGQKIFNDYGKEILEVVQDWENRLCSKAEGSGYGKYTLNLSEKFRQEVKKYLPKINSIGLQKA